MIDFLIVGTQKGGTSALFSYLEAHPDITTSTRKEVHFFDDDEQFLAGTPDYRQYEDFFPDHNARVAGESTPVYMYWPTAGDRIRRYNPAMKLIFVLRDPRERAYSQWWMEYNRGHETEPFARAIRLEESRRDEVEPGAVHRVYSYLDRGFYTRQIQRLLTLFNRRQMLFIRTEHLRERHDDTLARVFRFLDVPGRQMPEPQRVFVGDYPDMDLADRAYLSAHYRDEVRRLEVLLGWDCRDWCA